MSLSRQGVRSLRPRLLLRSTTTRTPAATSFSSTTTQRFQSRYCRHVSTVSNTKRHELHNNNSTDSTNNEYLRLIFDDKNVWNEQRQSYANEHPVGLLGNPHFTSIAGFEYAAQQAIQRAQLIVERIWHAPENGRSEMRRVVKNLDRLSDTLCSVIDLAEFLRNAHPGEETMEAANKAYMDLCYYMNTLNTDTRMHKVLAQVLADPSIVQEFTADEHAAAIVFLRDFEKSGIHLPNKQREKFVELSDQIIQLGREFVQRDPRGVQRIRIDPKSLNGLGQSMARAGSLDKDGYLHLPTDSQECQLILKYGENENVRRQVYEAVNSANGDSVAILEHLMKTRAELANLVGKSSFAELQLQDKMAKNPENVDAFLRTLLRHQEPASESDVRMLQETKERAMRLSSLPTVNAWDRDYYMHVYDVLDRQSQGTAPHMPYFSVGSVMQGLSRLFNHLYGIQFVSGAVNPGELWHDDVRKLDVVCEQEGKIGTIYCDLYSRAGKTTNAAHYTVRTSRRVDDDDADHDIKFAFPQQNISAEHFMPPVPQSASTIRGRDGLYQLPVIALTCDFNNTKNGTAMLSMFEIETLFHEMGHAMHSMLGRTDFHNVAGTRCATDFVELPSILMEHFIWHPEVIPLLCKDPSKAPSASTIQSYLQQRRRFNGIETNSQILMALLDQKYHSTLATKPDFSSVKTWHSLQDKVGLFPSAPGTMWPVQFGHLFGYGAGYYSYLFDRTVARRVWQKCFLQDPLNREQGLAFRDKLLKWGGARDPWQCVADVLGEQDAERIASGDEQSMRTVGDWGIDV
ncbi:hypothetical protein BDB00DRAFT_817165 [Zychaea mexicana]|uniref:uncharacterized protein n=1 Tax=Zychaea mexicana TaxID=64656 RepID=UPI0022FE1323|nr:uncharacterized protein BDB00DRAFT_817165 [Zychaea mexicana]KAI9494810.1 hypothetical protein BDB00DRAFT_817165 [Zychaea mexicana]